MGRSLKRILLYLFAIGLAIGCRQQETLVTDKPPLALLQLDSTKLVMTTVLDSLDVPRDMEWGPGDYIWFIEQKGTIGRVHVPSGKSQVLWTIPDVFHRKSTGAFSMALHPNFEESPYVFVHYTYAEKNAELLDQVYSRLIRLQWKDGKLGQAVTILDAIPGNTYHNGSSLVIDGFEKIWLALGDAGSTSKTQDPGVLVGKILRTNLDGTFPVGNPIANSPVWSQGHRNIQGLWVGKEHVYAAEHGPNNDDEINLIEKMGNYGWPDVHGYCNLDAEMAYCRDFSIIEPLRSWTPTIAPAGISYYNHPSIPEWQNSILLATLKGRSIRQLSLSDDGTAIERERIYLQQFLGRIRAVTVGPDGAVYLATSNLDWHPGHQPWMYDSLPTSTGDRIIKLLPLTKAVNLLAAENNNLPILRENLESLALQSENFAHAASEEELSAGKLLYMTHCAACHRPDGQGNIGEIPPLVESEWVNGNTARLIDVTLGGLNSPITVNEVRYEGEMPAYKHLKDEEIRDILNFIRQEFGGVAGGIIAADVMHQRKGLR